MGRSSHHDDNMTAREVAEWCYGGGKQVRVRGVRCSVDEVDQDKTVAELEKVAVPVEVKE